MLLLPKSVSELAICTVGKRDAGVVMSAKLRPGKRIDDRPGTEDRHGVAHLGKIHLVCTGERGFLGVKHAQVGYQFGSFGSNELVEVRLLRSGEQRLDVVASGRFVVPSRQLLPSARGQIAIRPSSEGQRAGQVPVTRRPLAH